MAPRYVDLPIKVGRASQTGTREQLMMILKKGAHMPKFLATHAVADVAKWKSFDAERTKVFTPFATDVMSYIDPKGGKTVALTMNVHDVAGMQAWMKTPGAAATMEKHGVVQPVTFLTA